MSLLYNMGSDPAAQAEFKDKRLQRARSVAASVMVGHKVPFHDREMALKTLRQQDAPNDVHLATALWQSFRNPKQ